MIEHEPGSGRLRLDGATFAGLFGQGPRAGSSALEAEVRAAAILTADGRPTADLRITFEPVRRPLCTLRISVAGAVSVQNHQAWLGESGAAVLLDLGQDRFDFMPMPPDHVPATAARVIRLGPRKAADRSPIAMDAHVMDDVWAAEEEVRGAALDEAGGRTDRLAFLAEMTWPEDPHAGRSKLTGRSVCGLGGPEGWWLARAEDSGDWTLMPTTPTVLWQLLIALLPTDAEMSRAASPPPARSG